MFGRFFQTEKKTKQKDRHKEEDFENIARV
jgi:hypothetical protein